MSVDSRVYESRVLGTWVLETGFGVFSVSSRVPRGDPLGESKSRPGTVPCGARTREGWKMSRQERLRKSFKRDRRETLRQEVLGREKQSEAPLDPVAFRLHSGWESEGGTLSPFPACFPLPPSSSRLLPFLLSLHPPYPPPFHHTLSHPHSLSFSSIVLPPPTCRPRQKPRGNTKGPCSCWRWVPGGGH